MAHNLTVLSVKETTSITWVCIVSLYKCDRYISFSFLPRPRSILYPTVCVVLYALLKILKQKESLIYGFYLGSANGGHQLRIREREKTVS